MSYVFLMSNHKQYKSNNTSIDKLEVFDGKNNKLLEFYAMQKISSKLQNGIYELKLSFDKKANDALGRYKEQYKQGNLNKVLTIGNKFIKVGNTLDGNSGDDILLGMSENGNARLNKSITAVDNFMTFVDKIGLRNIKFIVK